MRDRTKGKLKKKAKINLSILVLFSVIHLVVLIVYTKFKDPVQKEAEKSVIENFVREKEKWTNKGTDKQNMADSLIYSTTVHYQALYQRGTCVKPVFWPPSEAKI